jgi:hypothetical protein
MVGTASSGHVQEGVSQSTSLRKHTWHERDGSTDVDNGGYS